MQIDMSLFYANATSFSTQEYRITVAEEDKINHFASELALLSRVIRRCRESITGSFIL